MTPLLKVYALGGNRPDVGLGCGDAMETSSATQLIGHIISNYFSGGKGVLTVRGSHFPLKSLFNHVDHHQLSNDSAKRLLSDAWQAGLLLALSLRPD
jgi:hypothetical protein